jgi:hypothetical protein
MARHPALASDVATLAVTGGQRPCLELCWSLSTPEPVVAAELTQAVALVRRECGAAWNVVPSLFADDFRRGCRLEIDGLVAEERMAALSALRTVASLLRCQMADVERAPPSITKVMCSRPVRDTG